MKKIKLMRIIVYFSLIHNIAHASLYEALQNYKNNQNNYIIAQDKQ